MNTLLLVIRIKAMAKRANISSLVAGPKGATIQFHQDKFPNPGGLVEFLNEQKGAARISDNKLVVSRPWPTEADRIKGAFAVAKDLAAKIKAGTAKPDSPRPAEKPAAPKPAPARSEAKAAQPAAKPVQGQRVPAGKPASKLGEAGRTRWSQVSRPGVSGKPRGR